MTRSRHTGSHIASILLCVLMLALGLLAYVARGVAEGFGATPPDAPSQILDVLLLVVPTISLALVYLAGRRRNGWPILACACSTIAFSVGIYASAHGNVLLWMLFVSLGTSLAVAAYGSRKDA